MCVCVCVQRRRNGGGRGAMAPPQTKKWGATNAFCPPPKSVQMGGGDKGVPHTKTLTTVLVKSKQKSYF